MRNHSKSERAMDLDYKAARLIDIIDKTLEQAAIYEVFHEAVTSLHLLVDQLKLLSKISGLTEEELGAVLAMEIVPMMRNANEKIYRMGNETVRRFS